MLIILCFGNILIKRGSLGAPPVSLCTLSFIYICRHHFSVVLGSVLHFLGWNIIKKLCLYVFFPHCTQKPLTYCVGTNCPYSFAGKCLFLLYDMATVVKTNFLLSSVFKEFNFPLEELYLLHRYNSFPLTVWLHCCSFVQSIFMATILRFASV